MTDDRVINGAKAMHRVYEQRMERRKPFYTRQKWDAIGGKCQQEFIDWAKIILDGADKGEQ